MESYLVDILRATNPEQARNYAELPRNKTHRAQLKEQNIRTPQNKTYNHLYKKEKLIWFRASS
jgi:hypothetical protein